MTARILRNVRLFSGGVDLTGQTNKLEFSVDVDEQDVTTFGSYDVASDSVWKEVLGGIAGGEVAAEGFAAYGAGLVDELLFAQVGAQGGWSWMEHTANAGVTAFLTNGMEAMYKSPSGGVGEPDMWSASTKSAWPIVRGAVLNPPGTARTVSGVGTAFQLPATTARVGNTPGTAVYAALHMLSVTGAPSAVTVKVTSDSVAAFNVSPHDRVTFTSQTTQGGQVVRAAAGADTNTWYRAEWTITGGTTPSTLFLVTAGVGPA